MYLGKNTFTYCSRMTVVHVHVNVLSSCHGDAHGIKPGSNQNDCYTQNCMLGRKVICVRCINCSYNNIAKVIRFLDKMAIFVYTGKFSYKLELLKATSP